MVLAAICVAVIVPVAICVAVMVLAIMALPAMVPRTITLPDITCPLTGIQILPLYSYETCGCPAPAAQVKLAVSPVTGVNPVPMGADTLLRLASNQPVNVAEVAVLGSAVVITPAITTGPRSPGVPAAVVTTSRSMATLATVIT